MSIAWSDLFAALGLVLVFEGLMPFLSPQGFKRNLIRIVALPESTIRVVGMFCIGIGLLVLFFMRSA